MLRRQSRAFGGTLKKRSARVNAPISLMKLEAD
jgi:hypothetical protein